MKDLVTIVMPSYNTGKFIAESIQSVLDQTYPYWELIIVDDGSTDNTDEIVKTFLKDKRIRYLKSKKNNGAAVSRNMALKQAKGRWIAFLDSDDLWMPDKLKQQIHFMLRKKYSFSYTKYAEIDESGGDLRIKVSGPVKVTKLGIYCYCWMGCLTVMYDRNVIGDIQIANIKKNNDYAMWLKICKKADCYLYKKELAKYRRRAGSISNHSYGDLIKWHYKLFRKAERKNTVVSFLLLMNNLFFGVLKKFVYVRKKST